MKPGKARKRAAAGKPVKRVSTVKRKNTGAAARYYMQRGWWVLRGAAAGALVLTALYGAYLGFGKIVGLESLSVKTIVIDGCRDVRSESIRNLAGVSEGDPLLGVDLKEVRRRVASHPSVKDASVVRELPGTLRISVQERTPTAVVMGREFALVDGEGVALSLHDSYPEGYPLITGVTEIPERGRMMMTALPALKVLRNLSMSGLMGPEGISEIRVSGDTIRISLMGSGALLVLGHRDQQAQFGRLARLMEAGQFDKASAGYDLRFKGRVIGVPERGSDEAGGSG